MKRYVLTTNDNPYDPVDEMEQWRNKDYELAKEQGRPTIESMVAMFGSESSRLMDAENQRNINWAVDDAIKMFGEFGLKRVVIED